MEMSTTKVLFWIFACVFIVLLCCSIVATGLKHRAVEGKPHTGIDYFSSRVNAWWMLTIFIGLALSFGEVGVIILFAFISLQCLREYISTTKTRISDHHALVWCFYVFLPVQYFILAMHWDYLFSILIPVAAFLLLPMTAVLRDDTEEFLSRSSQIQWGLMICVYFLSHIPALMQLNVAGFEGKNALLVVFLLLIVQASNIFEYIWDKLIGSRKLVPTISATKSIEGLVFGLVCAMGLGAVLHQMTPFTAWQAALIALLIGLAGFAGQLVLMAIKRDRGVQDWGYRNEVGNGMLDLMDSICFVAPVFYYVVRFFWGS